MTTTTSTTAASSSSSSAASSGQRDGRHLRKAVVDLTAFSSTEMEFVAEDVLVTIVPNFKMGVLKLVRGEVGPFMPSVPVLVPVWMAIQLKRANQCRISMPSWMDAHWLNEHRKSEQQSDEFGQLPFHYIELASLFLTQYRRSKPVVCLFVFCLFLSLFLCFFLSLSRQSLNN
eukprot:TRINITY_DN66564_c13_g1_i1.p1 TRINITY_DN66564_c13_g1~~TRINITY_DN66564_c13_g1_i1.p1  ORF type:complete len:187 (-),score=56.53 TRINITY_DN66564_c13_g1_i1:465-983(-)